MLAVGPGLRQSALAAGGLGAGAAPFGADEPVPQALRITVRAAAPHPVRCLLRNML
ncbi:hypothetical protein TPY_3359 [Sulfobacillus acidophilus TPY]|nr:hypothetical protein TPY_3359 [Sulfobacillus acidophilus TPY]